MKRIYWVALTTVVVPLVAIAISQIHEQYLGRDTAAYFLSSAAIIMIILYLWILSQSSHGILLRCVSASVHALILVIAAFEIIYVGPFDFLKTEEVGIYAILISSIKIGILFVFPLIVANELRSRAKKLEHYHGNLRNRAKT